MIRRNPKTDRKVRESKKTIVAISPKQSLRDATGQAGQEPKLPLKCQVRIRYRHQAVPVVIRNQELGTGNQVLVEFKKPQPAVTPGQAVVFYQRNEVLGGGTIACQVI
jgi:tRNA U34 2-thiouridine synthase MnmA/TrmU